MTVSMVGSMNNMGKEKTIGLGAAPMCSPYGIPVKRSEEETCMDGHNEGYLDGVQDSIDSIDDVLNDAKWFDSAPGWLRILKARLEDKMSSSRKAYAKDLARRDEHE